MWFTSSWFNQLVENDISIFSTLQTLIVGGEKLSEFHIQKVLNAFPHVNIINGYGPTENTTFSLVYEINDKNSGTSIPIGRPLNNRSVYILDSYNELVPVGIPGQIYLGGAGLSRGYLNQSVLTDEKFIKNPFSNGSETRLYATGDLGLSLIHI